MPLVGIGKKVVASPGTAATISSTQTNTSAITIQADLANTGNMYIGDPNLNVSTGAGLIATLAAGMGWSSPVTQGNSIDLSKLFLDADNGTDFIVGSHLQV